MTRRRAFVQLSATHNSAVWPLESWRYRRKLTSASRTCFIHRLVLAGGLILLLNYFALALLLLALGVVFYVFIYIHELPYEAAKHRNHPQQDAIYVACWLSLFTLHAIWPLVFIWAISKPRPLDVTVTGGGVGPAQPHPDTIRRLGELESRLRQLEASTATPRKGGKA